MKGIQIERHGTTLYYNFGTTYSTVPIIDNFCNTYIITINAHVYACQCTEINNTKGRYQSFS